MLLANPQRGKSTHTSQKGGETGQNRSKVEFLSSGRSLGGGSLLLTRDPSMGPSRHEHPEGGEGAPCGSWPRKRAVGTCKCKQHTQAHDSGQPRIPMLPPSPFEISVFSGQLPGLCFIDPGNCGEENGKTTRKTKLIYTRKGRKLCTIGK